MYVSSPTFARNIASQLLHTIFEIHCILLKFSAITVPHQYLMANLPTPIEQYKHHLSLLSSHSTEKKRDSLAYLTTFHTSRPVNNPLPIPVSLLLPELYPLILNGSNSVRAQLILLLRTIPPNDLEPHIEQLLLYTRTGITHIALDIRSSASEILQWAIESCPTEVISCPGGWVKTLKHVLSALAWRDPPPTPSNANGKQSGWTSIPAALDPAKQGNEGNFRVKLLNALASLLRAGLIPTPAPTNPTPSKWPFPLRHVECHMIPRVSNPYRRLNLFGPPRDEDGEMYPEREERQRVFDKRFRAAVEYNVENAKRVGGQYGRISAAIGGVVAEGMADFQPDTDLGFKRRRERGFPYMTDRRRSRSPRRDSIVRSRD